MHGASFSVKEPRWEASPLCLRQDDYAQFKPFSCFRLVSYLRIAQGLDKIAGVIIPGAAVLDEQT